MIEQSTCKCERVQYNLVFACSGAADVGAIADRAARTLARENSAAMCCTAAIAAGVADILEKAASAGRIVVIDGCDKGCAKTILDSGGFTDRAYLELSTLGMEKGKTSVNDENVSRVAAEAASRLAAQKAE